MMMMMAVVVLNKCVRDLMAYGLAVKWGAGQNVNAF